MILNLFFFWKRINEEFFVLLFAYTARLVLSIIKDSPLSSFARRCLIIALVRGTSQPIVLASVPVSARVVPASVAVAARVGPLPSGAGMYLP
jgi:hypothetical protein